MNILHILICEDNEKYRKKVEGLIFGIAKMRKYDIQIVLSTGDPFAILEMLDGSESEEKFYLLDIDLHSKMNGLELAKRIRERDGDGYIVFLTAHIELSMLAFKYKIGALDYIDKADIGGMKTRIEECLEAAYLRQKKRDEPNIKSEKTISFDMNNNLIHLKLKDIIFFETAESDHKIRVHTANRIIEFYGVLREIEKGLSNTFFRIHRAYIINLKEVSAIDKTNRMVYMSTGQKCYVSVRYMKELAERLREQGSN